MLYAVTVDIVDVNDVVANAATFHVAANVDDVVALLTLLLLLLEAIATCIIYNTQLTSFLT